MQQYFHRLADAMKGYLVGEEIFTSSFRAEDSDFVRFNKAEVRQAGSVAQRHLSVDLIEGSRHASGTLTLSGEVDDDLPRIKSLFESLREQRSVLPEDPHLYFATEINSSLRRDRSRLPEAQAVVDEIQQAAKGRDLVGLHASGGIHAGFANSLGQRNWFETSTFNFDWSFYHSTDKAVKSAYAGFVWDPREFQSKIDLATEQLSVLAHPARTIEPGRYRVYLSPAALYDLVDMVGGDSFGLKARRTKQTPLLKMFEGDSRLAASVGILEATSEGVTPNFQESGFIRPDRVVLVEGGAPRDSLVSPRSAREYGVPTNGASASESPESVQLGAGELPSAEVLGELHTGLWIGNVWYLNYSDRSSCRTTGMTRFATFWVENGEIRAPVNVMRFDETFYRVLGENLMGLTAERDWILDPDTYHCRSTRSGRLPGALVDDFTLTL